MMGIVLEYRSTNQKWRGRWKMVWGKMASAFLKMYIVLRPKKDVEGGQRRRQKTEAMKNDGDRSEAPFHE